MANNLKDHLKEVADAIRAKKGTSDLINPQDFATEIEGISGSGGGESGGSNIEYLDLSGVDESVKTVLCGFGYLGKSPEGILPIPLILIESLGSISDKLSPIKSISIDFYTDLYNGFTIKTFIYQLGVTVEFLDSIPRITKEQFYDLNA